MTSLARLASRGSVGDLLTHATVEIFGVRGTSEQTVHDVVLSLLVCAVMTDPRSRIETPDDGAAPPAITALLDDLREIGHKFFE